MKHSVILGSYNRPRMVARAIASVRAQTVPDFQLLVTDDGSNEETIASIHRATAGDARCRVLTVPHLDDAEERPDCANRAVQRINDAIPFVEGDVVHYLADDDWYDPQKFAVFETLFADPGIVAGYGRLVYVDGAGRPIGMTRYPESVSDPLGALDHNQVAHRRCVFERLPRWADAVDWASEGHFFRAVSRIWPFRGIDRVVAYKTEHGLNMSSTQTRSNGVREQP
jgi:glycosyltransferase involved in cell wall biosynthesis